MMAGSEEVGTRNRAVTFMIVSFMSIAFYNVIELSIIAFVFFKRRSGLYFWSFLLATWGIVFHTLGFLTSHFGIITAGGVWLTIAIIGWIPMVTGQSLVLYSRLHLIVHNRKFLRLVLAMILSNVVVSHLPTIILAYGTVLAANPEPFIDGYNVYEKVQITLFFAQEMLISGLYIWHTYKSLGMGGMVNGARATKILHHLLIVNVFVIMLNIAVLSLEYNGLYSAQNAIKGAVYSIKLKMEFTVLNDLIRLARNRPAAKGSSSYGAELSPKGGGQKDHQYGYGGMSGAGESTADGNSAGHFGGDSSVMESSNNVVDNAGPVVTHGKAREDDGMGLDRKDGEVMPWSSSRDGLARRAF